MSLKLVSIKLNNVLGIQELEINPKGNIVEVSGRNGQGKTSIIESIKDAVGVSDYSTLLRNGETKGSVVLDLGDMVVQKTYKENGEVLKLEGKVMGTDAMSTINKPSSVLKTLINPDSVDPVRLLTCKPKDLLNAVLGAIPMKVCPDKLGAIVGKDGNVVSWNPDEHALVVLGKQTARIMEERKLINRDGKQAKITAEQLQTTLPDNIPVTEELTKQINENLELIENTRTAARKAGRTARGSFQEELETLIGEIQELDAHATKLQQQLETTRIEIASKSEKLRNTEELRTKASESAMEAELDKGDQYQNHNVELSEEIAGLKVFESTQAMVQDWKKKEAAATKAAGELSNQLKGIQAYKLDLCEDLPIKGLAIEDGLLTMNGISFQTLNTASRIDLVLELAKLSSGKLGLVVLDNSEMMDSETYAQFLKKAAETDLTFIVGRVADHDLTIN